MRKETVAALVCLLATQFACTKKDGQEPQERRSLAGGLAAPAIVSAPDSPCFGRVQDKAPRPVQAWARPPLGVWVTDPVFGTRILRISDNGPLIASDKAATKGLYSSVRAENADGTLAVGWWKKNVYNGYVWFNTSDYSIAGKLTFGGPPTNYTRPTDVEHLLWDPFIPNVMYYTAYDSRSGHSNTILMKLTLNWPAAPTVSLIRDFRAETIAGGADPNAGCTIGHVQDMSLDARKFITFRCGSSGTTEGNAQPQPPRVHILYSIAEDRVYATRKNGIQTPPHVCQSGNCSYDMNAGQILDVNWNQIGFITLYGKPALAPGQENWYGGSGDYVDHAALGSGPDGVDRYVKVGFDTPHAVGNLNSFKLNEAAPIGTVIIGPDTGWPYTRSQSHVSASTPDGWVAWSAVMKMEGQGTLDNEYGLGNIVTGEVCRLGQNRSRGKQNTLAGYFAEPHPQISKNGKRVYFASDWGGQDANWYVADLSVAPGPIPSPPPTPPPTPTPTPTPPPPTPTPCPTTVPCPSPSACPTAAPCPSPTPCATCPPPVVCPPSPTPCPQPSPLLPFTWRVCPQAVGDVPPPPCFMLRGTAQ